MADDESLDELDGRSDFGDIPVARRARSARRGSDRPAPVSRHRAANTTKVWGGVGGALVLAIYVVLRIGTRAWDNHQAEEQANTIIDAMTNSEIEGEAPDDLSVEDLRWKADEEDRDSCTFHFEGTVYNLRDDEPQDATVNIALLDDSGRVLAKTHGGVRAVPPGGARPLRTFGFAISKTKAQRLKRYRITVVAD